MFNQNFEFSFFFIKAKNAGVAIVTASIFNDDKGKKKPKFIKDNLGSVLKS